LYQEGVNRDNDLEINESRRIIPQGSDIMIYLVSSFVNYKF